MNSFNMDDVLNDSIREGQKDAAKGLFLVYRYFIEAGFTEAQALELLKVFMAISAADSQRTGSGERGCR